jgi:hypothetical protein
MVDSHLMLARIRHPTFGGLKCVLSEVADLIKADESGDREAIRREALHVAVTAIRLYDLYEE